MKNIQVHDRKVNSNYKYVMPFALFKRPCPRTAHFIVSTQERAKLYSLLFSGERSNAHRRSVIVQGAENNFENLLSGAWKSKFVVKLLRNGLSGPFVALTTGPKWPTGLQTVVKPTDRIHFSPWVCIAKYNDGNINQSDVWTKQISSFTSILYWVLLSPSFEIPERLMKYVNHKNSSKQRRLQLRKQNRKVAISVHTEIPERFYLIVFNLYFWFLKEEAA